MAYQNKVQIEHPFKKIAAQIKEGQLKTLLFFYGKEEYLIRWATDQIITKYVNPQALAWDVVKLDGELTSLNEIKNSCETLSMMSDRRVVLLKNLKLAAGEKSRNFPADEEEALLNYMEQLSEGSILIITATHADKRKKFYKTVEKWGEAYDFCQLDEKQLAAFINKRLKQEGKKASPRVIQQFINYTGYFAKESEYTLFHLDNDLKKIIAAAEEEELSLTNITSVLSASLDTNVFSMIDAISQNRKDEAFVLLHNQLVSGENLYKLLSIICGQFELILAVKEMKSNGSSLEQMKAKLKIHEFRIKKASAFAERYSIEYLKKILIKAYDVDKNIKTGLLDATLALEMFIAEI